MAQPPEDVIEVLSAKELSRQAKCRSFSAGDEKFQQQHSWLSNRVED